MIDARNLTKWYGPTLAVDDLSLSIPAGRIVGFLGPNGAGKSTTIRMLTGYLPPTSGSASIAGFDTLTAAQEARRRLGYLPESTPLYLEMRVTEYLDFVGRLHGMDRARRRRRIGEVCERCGLAKLHRRVIARLSKGNRQRVGIASTLLHEPAVLVLDEPTSGLDPTQMSQVRHLIRELAGTHTVLLSTHLLPEVQRVADAAVMIAGGRVVAEGTIDELRNEATRSAGRSPVTIEARGTCETVRGALSKLRGIAELKVAVAKADEAGEAGVAGETFEGKGEGEGGGEGEGRRACARGCGGETSGGWVEARVVPEGRGDVRAAAAEALSEAGILVREIRREAATLEEFFIRVTDTGGGGAEGVAGGGRRACARGFDGGGEAMEEGGGA